MKKLIGMLFVAILFVFPIYANAGSLGTVDLKMDWGWNGVKGNVVFPVLGAANNEPLDYHAIINNGSPVDAFCVENVYGSWNTEKYTLYTLDGYDVRYLKAAAIAEYFYNNDTDANKAGAQLAIWEVMWDAGFDLSAGSFKAVSDYNDEALSIWNAAVVGKNFSNYSSNSWVVAHSPADGITGPNYQDQLVRHNVPEPATMLLLGLGLMGLAGVRRKFKK